MNAGLNTPPSNPSQPAGAGAGLVHMGVSAIIARVEAVHTILEKVMIEGTHYYSIGTRDERVWNEARQDYDVKKVPQYSLGKSGAEMLCLTFGIAPDIETKVVLDDPTSPRTIQVSEWVDDPVAKGGRRKVTRDQTVTGVYEVKSTCSVWDRSGTLLARASGTCNNLESAFRNQGYSDAKNGVLKRSEKRALVAAVLMATGASDMFTQDLEDLGTGDGAGTTPGAPPPPPASAGWLSEAQIRLLAAKAKKIQAIPGSLLQAVIDHMAARLNGMTRDAGKAQFNLIADEKAEASELWTQALAAAQAAAASPKQ